MIEDYGGWRIDVATQCMIHVFKVCAVAFAYRDGAPDVKEELLFSHQVKGKLRELPSLLEYQSYNFCCCGCLL